MEINNLNFNEINDTATSENIIRSWQIQEGTDLNPNNLKTSKIILTDKRLIISENDKNKSYRKFSHKIQDIKAVNSYIGQKPKKLKNYNFLLIIGIPLLLLSICLFSVGLPIVAPLCLLIISLLCFGMYIFLKLTHKPQSDKIILITIEISKNDSLDILEAKTAEYGSIKNQNIIKAELRFPVCQESINIATELDNLILDTQYSNIQLKESSVDEEKQSHLQQKTKQPKFRKKKDEQ